MNILINASNLKAGGGVQVADSIIREIHNFSQHNFLVVGTEFLEQSMADASKYNNIRCLSYTMPNSILGTLIGKNSILDKIVVDEHINVVITIFGPAKWEPAVKHISGYAKPQLVLPESPFWSILPLTQKIKYTVTNFLTKHSFRVSAEYYYTENEFITKRVSNLFPEKKVITITNTYNQVFDDVSRWKKDINLGCFDGLTLLTIAANYPHKNIKVIPRVIKSLKSKHPDLKFRFVLSQDQSVFPDINEEIKNHIVFLGRVSIDQCPHLYEQSNIMFLPTLLECFSASYAEAMKMKVPIITSDLGFAHSLCSDAAVYVNPIDPMDIADKIYELANNKRKQEQMVSRGVDLLQGFDTYSSRARKLIEFAESI